MIDIKTDQSPITRRKKSNNLRQFVFFGMSLIPMIIIAWRIDLVNLGAQQIVQQPTAQQPSQPPSSPNPDRPRQRTSTPRPNAIPPAEQPNERPPIVEAPPPVVEPQPAEPPAFGPRIEPRADKKPSAIATLTLESAVIRVIANADESMMDSVLCDVSFSENLMSKFGGVGTDQLVADRLRRRDTKLIELPVGIKGAGAAIEIRIVSRRDTIACELRPLMSLPFGESLSYTKDRGVLLHSRMTKAIDDARVARSELPSLKSQRDKLQREITRLKNLPLVNGPNPAAVASEIRRLNGLVQKLNRNIASAEKDIAFEQMAKNDLDAINQLGEFAARIASVSMISVRFYSGDVTLPATVK